VRFSADAYNAASQSFTAKRIPAELTAMQVEIVWNAVPIAADGDGKVLTSVKIRDTITGAQRSLDVRGLFYAIGHTPNTAFLNGQLALDETVRRRLLLRGAKPTLAQAAWASLLDVPHYARHGARATLRSIRARRGRRCRASLPAVTCRTRSTARRSPPPARVAWPRSKPSGGSRPR